jgi:hypothetical protein
MTALKFSHLSMLLAGAMTVAALAQPEASVKIRIRAVLHDPMKPFVAMYVLGAGGALERLNLALEGLTETQTVTLSKGMLHLYALPTVYAAVPAAPAAKRLASVAVPDEVKHAILILLPAAAQAPLPYQLLVINDAATAFAMGESRVLNLTKMPLAIQAGEHKLEVAPAKITAVPPVTQVNHMNQAQTLFYQKVDKDWLLLSERPMQYTHALRNIFLIYLMPNVDEPQIRTLIDTTGPR